MTSVLPVRLGYKQKTPRMWGPLLEIYFLLIDYFLHTKKQMVSI